ncbi:inositol monophosphatase [bacterium]|nr:inositol monophosphatase [bacterium]
MEFAIDIAREAGRIMMDGLGRRPRVSKKSQRELVTEVDEACERHVIARIRAAFPDHDYFAEEGSRREQKKSPYRWIVDPLDGTTNYAHGIPLFSISLGLEKAGEIAGGVVFAPYLNEMFFATKGQGAFLNSRTIPIHVSETDAIPEAVLATGFAYVLNQTPNTNLENFVRVTREARATRRFGSAALDLAYVACGRYDGFWEMHLKAYDVAAGALLVREAGGKVTDFLGGEEWLEGQSIVATNGRVHEALRSRLDPLRPDGHVRAKGMTA